MTRLGCLVTLLLLFPAAAAADPGGISQLPGGAGCVTSSALADCADAPGLEGASAIALSPGGEHAYVASASGVAVFARDAGSGALTALGCLSSTGAEGCAPARGLPDPSAVAVSPDGANVYVASYQDRGLAVFARGGDGALTQLAGAAGCLAEEETCGEPGGFGPVDLAISPDGQDVYVAELLSGSVSGYRRGAGGALTALAAPGGCLVQPDPNGVLGEGDCQQPRAFSGPQELDFAPGGQLLVAGGQNSASYPSAVTVYDRDPASGFLAQPAGTVGCIVDDLEEQSWPDCGVGFYLQQPTALAIAPDGAGVHVAYGSGKFDGLGAEGYGVMSADRDLSSGLLTERRPGTGFGSPPYDRVLSLVVSPDGRNVYGARQRWAGELEGNGITAWARSGGLYEVQGPTGCVSDNGTGGRCATGRGLGQPREIVSSPDGRFLYAAAAEPGAVTVFAREAPGAFNDVDHDGVADGDDQCPSEPGPSAGCPDYDDGFTGGDGAGDTTAPRGVISVAKRARLRRVLKRGRVGLRFSCDERSEVDAALRLPRKQARKLRLKRAIARPQSALCEGDETRARLSIWLKPKARKRLRRARKVKPSLVLGFRDAAGNRSRSVAVLTWR